jgi:glycosyltransferase involved in cell wall biosynthesis
MRSAGYIPTARLFLPAPMRVLLVLNWFMKYATEQANGLTEAGAEVQVVCRDHLAEFGGSEEEWQHCIDRVTAVTGNPPWVIRGSGTGRHALEGAVRGSRLARLWKPDVVHAHPNVSPALFAIVPRSPLVLTIHDVVPHPGQPHPGAVKQQVERAWERRAAAFVVHGEDLRVLLRPRAGGRPVAVVPHGVRPAEEPDPIPDKPSILFFGRLEPYKGLGVLMEAMRLVWAVRPDVELVVAGQGPSESELLDDRRIRRITRYVSEAEVPGLFRGARLLVAPYTEGSQSGVVSLACAQGVPSVVSAVGALPSLVVDPSQVVPPGEPELLAGALIANLDHDAGMRRKVLVKAQQELSWRSAAELTIGLYQELLGN